MPFPLMNIWDATFKEKAAGGRVDVCTLHERPRCHGLLNQSQRHRTPSRSRAFHDDDADAQFSRLPCTVAGSTLHVLDEYGLRDSLPARPTPDLT